MATNATPVEESDASSSEQTTLWAYGAQVADRARQQEHQRIMIEDNGQWNWSLTVETGEIVRASKAIPYDGTRVYSTKETTHSRSSRRRGSQFSLSTEEVLDRYQRHSRTELTVAQLHARIRAVSTLVEGDE